MSSNFMTSQRVSYVIVTDRDSMFLGEFWTNLNRKQMFEELINCVFTKNPNN